MMFNSGSQLSTIDLHQILIILTCVVGSALFSASETAITSIGILKARHLAEQDERAKRAFSIWLGHPDHILTTILVWNTGINIFASATATQMAARHFENHSVGIATGITTFLILVFGEIAPKSFARVNHVRLSIFLMAFINFLCRATYPLIWTLTRFAQYIIHRLGSSSPIHPRITEEELEFLIKEGEKAGVLEETKTDMLSGVFEFDEVMVREIMTPRTDIRALEKEGTFDDALNEIISSGHSRLPVYDNSIDNIIGIIYAKDVLRHLSQRNQGQKLPSIITIMREPLFVPESRMLLDVFKDLKRTKKHMAVIVDEYGGTSGLVTMEDALEQIVGDIQDEFDQEEAQIIEVEPGVFDVSGSVSIADFVDYFNLDDSFDLKVEGNVDTIAGWMTQLLGELPKIGQTQSYPPLTLEVSEVARHRIEKLRVIRMLSPETEDPAVS